MIIASLLTTVKESSCNEEASRLFFANIVLASKARKLTQENKELRAQLADFQSRAHAVTLELRAKRKRRTKDQVRREHICKVVQCGKAYG